MAQGLRADVTEVSLAEALDIQGLTWGTSAGAEWVGRAGSEVAAVAHDGEDLANSGAIAAGESSVLSTTIYGAGTLTFWYRVDEAGEHGYFRVFVDGVPQLEVSGTSGTWTQKTITLTGNVSHSVEFRFEKDAESENGDAGGAYLDQVEFTAAAPTSGSLTLKDALDGTELAWSTSGSAGWQPLASASAHDSSDYAKSGVLEQGQSSTLVTEVTGAGTLSFWYKVSSELHYDVLTVTVDGTKVVVASGETGWANKTIAITGAGKHTVTWTYAKSASDDADDDSDAIGEDCAYLDEVSFVAATEETPAADTTAPNIYFAGEVRFSDTDGIVSVVSDEEGQCFYQVVNHGAAAPVVFDKGNVAYDFDLGWYMHVQLTAGAKDVYVVVKDAAGNFSNPYKVEIPAYAPAEISVDDEDEYVWRLGQGGAGVEFYSSDDSVTISYLVQAKGAVAPSSEDVLVANNEVDRMEEGSYYYIEFPVIDSPEAQDLYIVVTGEDGSVSAPFNVEVPAFALQARVNTVQSFYGNDVIAYPNQLLYGAGRNSEIEIITQPNPAIAQVYLPNIDQEFSVKYYDSEGDVGTRTTSIADESEDKAASINGLFVFGMSAGTTSVVVKVGDEVVTVPIEVSAAITGSVPVISDIEVDRTSDTNVTITFSTNREGYYGYFVKEAGAEVPTKGDLFMYALLFAGLFSDSWTGLGETTFSIPVDKGAKDVYIGFVGQSSLANNERIYVYNTTKVEVPEYVAPLTDAEIVANVIETLTFDAIKGTGNSGESTVVAKLNLPKTDTETNATIVWTCDDDSVINPVTGAVTRPAYGEPDAHVMLTATVTLNGESDTVKFHLIVLAAGNTTPPDLDDITVTLPALGVVDGIARVHEGSELKLTATLANAAAAIDGGSTVTFQWFYSSDSTAGGGDVEITEGVVSTATSSTLTVSRFTSGDTGWYYVRATGIQNDGETVSGSDTSTPLHAEITKFNPYALTTKGAKLDPTKVTNPLVLPKKFNKDAPNKGKPVYTWTTGTGAPLYINGKEVKTTAKTATVKTTGIVQLTVTWTPEGATTATTQTYEWDVVVTPVLKFHKTLGLTIVAQTTTPTDPNKGTVVKNGVVIPTPADTTAGRVEDIVFTAKLDPTVTENNAGFFTNVPVIYKWYHNNVLVQTSAPTYDATDSLAFASDAADSRFALTAKSKVYVTVETQAPALNAKGSPTGKPLSIAKSKAFAVKGVLPPTVELNKGATSVIAAAGKAVTLSAKAKGTSPFKYTWYNPAGEEILGMTKATLKLGAPVVGGVYTVRVTNPTGAAYSATATIEVVAP